MRLEAQAQVTALSEEMNWRSMHVSLLWHVLQLVVAAGCNVNHDGLLMLLRAVGCDGARE